MQGQGHSQTTCPLLRQTRRGSAQAIALDVDVFDRAVAVWPSVHAPNRRNLHFGGMTVAQQGRRTTFAAGNVSFAVQHELWDGNVDDHSDQGVAILVIGQVEGMEQLPAKGQTVSMHTAACLGDSRHTPARGDEQSNT